MNRFKPQARRKIPTFPQWPSSIRYKMRMIANLGFGSLRVIYRRIRAALVSLLGWGNSSFSNDCFNNDARLSKFFKSEVANEKWSLNVQPGSSLAERGMGEFLRLLVVPNFPRSESKIKIVTELLQKAGVDGVLTLSAILENLLRQTLPSGGSPSHSVFCCLDC